MKKKSVAIIALVIAVVLALSGCTALFGDPCPVGCHDGKCKICDGTGNMVAVEGVGSLSCIGCSGTGKCSECNGVGKVPRS